MICCFFDLSKGAGKTKGKQDEAETFFKLPAPD